VLGSSFLLSQGFIGSVLWLRPGDPAAPCTRCWNFSFLLVVPSHRASGDTAAAATPSQGKKSICKDKGTCACEKVNEAKTQKHNTKRCCGMANKWIRPLSVKICLEREFGSCIEMRVCLRRMEVRRNSLGAKFFAFTRFHWLEPASFDCDIADSSCARWLAVLFVDKYSAS